MTGDRFPMPSKQCLSPEQQQAIDQFLTGPRVAIVGPFIPLLRCPELMTRVQVVGEYVRFDSELDDHLVEVAILSVARFWDQQFEWGFHYPIARDMGLSEETLDAIACSRRPDADTEVGVVWEVVDQIQRLHRVDDATFALAKELLGDTKFIELVTVVGYYTTLAMVMNTSNTPAPDDGPRLPPIKPECAT